MADTLARLPARSAHDVARPKQRQAGDQRQIALTDPDSRSMVDHHRTMVGYNVQCATDSQHTVIVAHEVTHAITDQGQVSEIAHQAQAVLDGVRLDVLADGGYDDGDQITAGLDGDMTPWVPKPHTARTRKAGRCTQADWYSEQDRDTYQCPAGSPLTYRCTTVEHGRPTRS